MAKVYKARYYPNSSFMSAILGVVKFCLEERLEAQSVIKEGVSCKVGSGTTVNVLKDP